MRLLLDTCAFLWWIADDPALSGPAAEAIRDPKHQCGLSVASLWEILIKHATGRLEIDSGAQSAFDFLVGLCADTRIALLPVAPNEIRHVSTLPDIHRDPFDRLLICQTIEHGLTLVTPDPQIRRYPVKTLW